MLKKYDISSYNHQYATVNGIRMHYVDENSKSSKALLLLHGWPDLWIGWREQIYLLSELGYRVIVPSLRGFGETDAPADPSEYGFGTVSKDLAALLDHLHIPTVTVIGHDWGGLVTWRFAQFYPDRVRALVSFCTPYTPPSQKPDATLEQIVKAFPNFEYQLFLTTPKAEHYINENQRKFFHRMFKPEAGESYREIVPEHILDYYVQTYAKTGSRGGLNWYKQTQNNYVQCKDLDPMIRKPALMVAAELDKALPPVMTSLMPKYIPGVDIHTVNGSGHWVLWEKTEECNKLLTDFLYKIDPVSSSSKL